MLLLRRFQALEQVGDTGGGARSAALQASRLERVLARRPGEDGAAYGICTRGACRCDSGYRGPACSELANLCPDGCSGHGGAEKDQLCRIDGVFFSPGLCFYPRGKKHVHISLVVSRASVCSR